MNLRKWLGILLLGGVLAGCKETKQTASPEMEWWREARFGMFVHWGLYSVAAGEWNGKSVDGIGEWIQNFAKVPNSDYEKLAADFTMANYNPEEWVKMAKNAGARYIIFTAKHHEGFCLYPSDVSDFDVERTPYKGDPLKELTEACRKYGLKVGLYYSHRQDWHEEDAAVMKNEYDGHYGKPKAEIKPDLDNGETVVLVPYNTPLSISVIEYSENITFNISVQPYTIINYNDQEIRNYVLGEGNSIEFTVVPAFGATNQLLAAFAAFFVYLWKRQMGKPTLFISVPMVVMFIITISAMIDQVYRGMIAEKPNYLVSAVLICILCMTAAILFDAIRKVFQDLKQRNNK